MQKAQRTGGRRARKRAETRARILSAARDLFLRNGFDATTIEEIADRADISKRSFFDYFPTKEDVIASWQDVFGDLLVAKVAARPSGESPAEVVRKAMVEAISSSVSPDGIEMDRLVRDTPSLKARMHLKYARLEARLAQALQDRLPASTADNRLVGEGALLAMVAIGILRLGSDAWRPVAAETDVELYTSQVFADLWFCLTRIAKGAP